MAPLLKFNIRGISFKQDAAEGLHQGQSLLLLREPGNQYDKNAVAVHTLSGKQVGYVPKEIAPEFKLGALMGRVVSAGKTEGGLTGATVTAHNTLLPLLLEPLPNSAAGQVQALCAPGSAAATQALQGSRIKACEIMGVPEAALGQPLVVVPTFVYDSASKTVQLVKLVAVCPAVAAARQLLAHSPGSRARGEAAEVVRAVNGWGEQELAEHLEWAQARQAAMDQDKWSVKL